MGYCEYSRDYFLFSFFAFLKTQLLDDYTSFGKSFSFNRLFDKHWSVAIYRLWFNVTRLPENRGVEWIPYIA